MRQPTRHPVNNCMFPTPPSPWKPALSLDALRVVRFLTWLCVQHLKAWGGGWLRGPLAGGPQAGHCTSLGLRFLPGSAGRVVGIVTSVWWWRLSEDLYMSAQSSVGHIQGVNDSEFPVFFLILFPLVSISNRFCLLGGVFDFGGVGESGFVHSDACRGRQATDGGHSWTPWEWHGKKPACGAQSLYPEGGWSLGGHGPACPAVSDAPT